MRVETENQENVKILNELTSLTQELNRLLREKELASSVKEKMNYLKKINLVLDERDKLITRLENNHEIH